MQVILGIAGVLIIVLILEGLLRLFYRKPKEQSVAESIQGAKEQLFIITGSGKDGLLTPQHIPMLQRAIERGVKIKIILDQTVEQSFIQEIKDLGVKTVLVDQSAITSYGLLIDYGLRLITGDHGSYMEITKPILLHSDFEKQFSALWENA